MKDSLKTFIEKFKITGIVMGTRITDPYSQRLKIIS